MVATDTEGCALTILALRRDGGVACLKASRRGDDDEAALRAAAAATEAILGFLDGVRTVRA